MSFSSFKKFLGFLTLLYRFYIDIVALVILTAKFCGCFLNFTIVISALKCTHKLMNFV